MQAIQTANLALSQNQNMTLKLAPQMRMMMHLLAMPVLELREEIKKKLDENPALEEVSSSEVLLSSLEDTRTKDDTPTDWDEDKADRKQQFLENTLTQKESLQDHLLIQLGMQKNIDKPIIDAAEILVQNLNNDGFLEI